MPTTSETNIKCKVCEAPARYSYYGVVACESCKVFFRRNARTKQTILKCHFDNDCEISLNSRQTCIFCRLKKCFAKGMSPEMIRACRSQTISKSQKAKPTTDSTSSITTASSTLNKKNQMIQIPILNLLRSDQSTLTNEQWNLLSNLVHSFDQYGGYSYTQNYIQQQNTLPTKLRFKHSSVKDFFTLTKMNVQLVLEKNRDLQSLSSHDRTTLLRTTIEYTTSIGGMFTLRQHHLFDYPSFYNSAEMIFRPTSAAFARYVINQLDPDDTFIKLVLAILSFSTTTYVVYTKFDENNLINIKAILPIQDMYTEITWRYLLYKYGFDESVRRFSNLIRCLFHVNSSIVEAHESKQFVKMIDNVIEQSEQLLHL